jgi:hypothetical protein
LHGIQERLAPTPLIGLDNDSVAGFKLNTEHTPSGGRVEQAAHGESVQFPDAEGLKDFGEQFGFVGAENVTIDRTRAVPTPAVEVVLDDGCNRLHGLIMAAPLRQTDKCGTTVRVQPRD